MIYGATAPQYEGYQPDLQYLYSHGMITDETIRAGEEMQRREILSQHTNSIWQGKDGYWRTRVRTTDGSSGRRLIKKRTRQDLEDAIVAFYRGIAPKPKAATFYPYSQAFQNWIKAQAYPVANTEMSYRRMYKRLFLSGKLEDGERLNGTDIRWISARDIEAFLIDAAETYELRGSKVKEIYNALFVSVYEQAQIDRAIMPNNNPCNYVKFIRIERHAKRELSALDQRIISAQTLVVLKQACETDHQKKPWYIPPYATEMAMLTGMRNGELGGLQWKNVDMDGGILHVCQSRKFDEKARRYFISDTKNGIHREIPITPELRELLEEIREMQSRYGCCQDFVFSTDGKIATNRELSDYLFNKKAQYKIDEPVSLHAIRRTLNSKMEANGVQATLRSALLGHSERVNRRHYTYDTSTGQEKELALANASLLC